MYQPTDDEIDSIRQWFAGYDELAKQGAIERMADLGVFPMNLATDVPGGYAAVTTWSRQDYLDTMSGVIGDGSAGMDMKSVRTPHFLNENLVVVHSETVVTVAGETTVMNYADLLVRTRDGWGFQTMIQGGWGHGWTPATLG